MGEKKMEAGEFKFSLNRKGEPVIEAPTREWQARAIASLNTNPVTVIVKR